MNLGPSGWEAEILQLRQLTPEFPSVSPVSFGASSEAHPPSSPTYLETATSTGDWSETLPVSHGDRPSAFRGERPGFSHAYSQNARRSTRGLPGVAVLDLYASVDDPEAVPSFPNAERVSCSNFHHTPPYPAEHVFDEVSPPFHSVSSTSLSPSSSAPTLSPPSSSSSASSSSSYSSSTSSVSSLFSLASARYRSSPSSSSSLDPSASPVSSSATAAS